MAIELTTSNTEVKTVFLFSIDDRKFYVPAEPRANVGLRYMNLVATKGEGVANDYILTESLGQDGYEALMNWDGLTPDVLNQILEAATKIVMGDGETNPNS